MTAVIYQFRAGLRRAAFPLVAPRLVCELVQVGMFYALLPMNVACAAIDGYAEAQRAVMRPPFAPRGLTTTRVEVNELQKIDDNAALLEV